MLRRTHINNAERERLKYRLAQLEALHTHGLGQIGATSEMHEARRLMAKLKERLNPAPLEDLEAAAEALISRFGLSPWVEEALAEATEEV